IPDPARAAAYRGLASPAARVPETLGPIADALVAPTDIADANGAAVHLSPAPTAVAPSLSLRRERLATFGDRAFVVTRNRWIDAEAERAGDRFARAAVALLASRASAIARTVSSHPLPAVPDRTPPHLVRVYLVSEDGTLVSAPWPSDGAQD